MNKHDNIVIIDYGMGNIWSVLNALRYLGTNPVVSKDPQRVMKAQYLVLPGVGSFSSAMKSLHSTGLDQAILEAVKIRQSKILGICLGMQLFGTHGTEDGDMEGLGLIPARVEKFSFVEIDKLKIPHIGFNVVKSTYPSGLFRGLPDECDFYFVHSYRMLPHGLSGNVARCEYGVDFLAAYENGNIYATQFHPEKSQTNGLILLNNFISQ